MTCLRNWRCYSYKVQGRTEEFEYQELKDYFQIDGGETAECLRDFGDFHKGEQAIILEGPAIGQRNLGFLIAKDKKE